MTEVLKCPRCDGPISRFNRYPKDKDRKKTPWCSRCLETLIPAPHKVLREAYRHYYEFKELVTNSTPDPNAGSRGSNKQALNNQEAGLRDTLVKGLSISFWDLKRTLESVELSPRKAEAFRLNVLEDMKQDDVGQIMGITTVTVGQYVEQAMKQLAKEYFKNEDVLENED